MGKSFQKYKQAVEKIVKYNKHSEAHRHKTESIAAELDILGQDTSNLGLYIDRAVHFAVNLPEMWQKLDLSGKVRLQKLVYPAGLQYAPENGTLRTLEVNPIFSAITSISNNLIANTSHKTVSNMEKFHQVYLGFSSSNFLWENLEKIAIELDEALVYTSRVTNSIVSVSGIPTSIYIRSSTANNQLNNVENSSVTGSKSSFLVANVLRK